MEYSQITLIDYEGIQDKTNTKYTQEALFYSSETCVNPRTTRRGTRGTAAGNESEAKLRETESLMGRAERLTPSTEEDGGNKTQNQEFPRGRRTDARMDGKACRFRPQTFSWVLGVGRFKQQNIYGSGFFSRLGI